MNGGVTREVQTSPWPIPRAQELCRKEPAHQSPVCKPQALVTGHKAQKTAVTEAD